MLDSDQRPDFENIAIGTRGTKYEAHVEHQEFTHHGGGVHSLGVGHGHGGVSVHEQHRHRHADDVGTAEYDSPLPRDLHAIAVQELDAALRRVVRMHVFV